MGACPMRKIKYKEALSEALCQSMARDGSIIVCGISVNYSSGVFGSTKEAATRFPDRVITTPACENALTGICIGAAAMGKRPVIVHDRVDFSFLAMDQLINLAAKWKYMFGGNAGSVPVVTRAIIGRGWGQGATHSQSLQSLFAHFPGLAVVMPATPHDAKGLLTQALTVSHPTVILEHRSLYEIEGDVPEPYYTELFGSVRMQKSGRDLTIVATSHMVQEALAAARTLADHSISAEVVDPRSIRPLDEAGILASVRKTGRLIVADTSHQLCGFASEVAALAAEKAFHSLRRPIVRVTLPDCPAPVAQSLEQAFYPGASQIVTAALAMMGRKAVKPVPAASQSPAFVGPY